MDRMEVRGYIEISGTNGVEVKNFEGGSGTNTSPCNKIIM